MSKIKGKGRSTAKKKKKKKKGKRKEKKPRSKRQCVIIGRHYNCIGRHESYRKVLLVFSNIASIQVVSVFLFNNQDVQEY